MPLKSIMNTMSQTELFFGSQPPLVRSAALTHGYIWSYTEWLLQLWVLRRLHGRGLAKQRVISTRKRYKPDLYCQRLLPTEALCPNHCAIHSAVHYLFSGSFFYFRELLTKYYMLFYCIHPP